MLRLKPTPLVRKLRGRCGHGVGHRGVGVSGRHGSMKQELTWTCQDHERPHLCRHHYPFCRVVFFSSRSPQTTPTTAQNNASMASSRALHERRVAEAQSAIVQKQEELRRQGVSSRGLEAQAASVQKQEGLLRALHERRVAEAQAAISQQQEQRQQQLGQEQQLQLQTQQWQQHHPEKQQQQQQQQQQQLSLQEGVDLKRTKAERRNFLVNSIRHWLAKDAEFFECTMAKLSINSNWLIINSAIHNNTSTDLEHHDSKEKKSTKPNSTAVTTGTPPHLHPNDRNHLNQNHAVWKQYRHLYYDSIGSFRNELERNPPVSLQEILEELEDSQFGNARFCKLYRQERGHQFQQLNLEQRLLNQREDFRQQQEVLEDMQSQLEELQNKLHQQEQRYLQRQRQKQQLEQQQQLLLQPQPPKERLGMGKEQSYQTTTATSAIKQEDSSSILSHAWQVVSSLLRWGASPVSRNSNSTKRQEVNEQKDWLHSPRIYYPPNDNTNTNSTPQPFHPLPTGSPPPPLGAAAAAAATAPTTIAPTPLHREVLRQKKSIKEQEHSIEISRQKVQRLEQLQREEKKKSPIVSNEYQQAQELVASVRDPICHELALHIQERHKQLIAQYQTLDAKTGKSQLCVSPCHDFRGQSYRIPFSDTSVFVVSVLDLTKPHEWYSYARLDQRKVRIGHVTGTVERCNRADCPPTNSMPPFSIFAKTDYISWGSHQLGQNLYSLATPETGRKGIVPCTPAVIGGRSL
jgi:hypothetical protein